MNQNDSLEHRLCVSHSAPLTKQPEATSRLRQDTRNEKFEMTKLDFKVQDSTGMAQIYSDLDGPDSSTSRTVPDASYNPKRNCYINPIYEDTEVMLNGKADVSDHNEPEYAEHEP